MQEIDVMKLDGHGLRVFLAVLDEGSMTGAALTLGLNQSTISHTIDKLRSALRDPLFVRVGRNVLPTAYAAALAPRVRALLADLQGLPASAAFDPMREEEFVSLAANVTQMSPELLALRDRLRHLAPRIKFRILELGSRENADRFLISGKVDLVISVQAPSYAPELMVQPLLEDGFVVFYDPEQRGPVRTIEEYCKAEHAALHFGGSAVSAVELALRERMLEREVSLQVGNAHNLGSLMKGTKFICTMQSRLKRSVFSHLAYCPPPMSLPNIKFDLLWHRRHDADARNIWLRSIVREVILSEIDNRRSYPHVAGEKA